MKKIKNIRIKGKHGKDILVDAFFTENGVKKDVVLFCHGYKGYKDWGAWDLVAEKFARKNFFFVKRKCYRTLLFNTYRHLKLGKIEKLVCDL